MEGIDLDPKSFISKEKKLETKMGPQSETINSDTYESFLSSTSDKTGLFLWKLQDHTQTGAVHSYISTFHNIISHLELSKQMKISEFHQGLKEPKCTLN